ncbi:MAG: HAMP domain-containing histidine kinase [Caulobacteraceae bacterium]|nr:HAMP domain-containing histidine kinase [Caulobacter sp.]
MSGPERADAVRQVVEAAAAAERALAPPRLPRAPEVIDLRRQDGLDWLLAPFATLSPGPPRVLRVLGAPAFRGGDFVEVVVAEAPLRAELRAFLARLLLTAFFISACVGVLVYLVLNAVLVAPMRRLVEAMQRFRARPDDPAARVAVSRRRDEVGRAEAELARMQEDLVTALQTRARLAALGEAVAKINHDLRNMLSSARMASDRLAGSADPAVATALPRLERALDRAQKLAEGVLAYGRSEEAPPERRRLPLAEAVQAAADDAGLSPEGVRLRLASPEALTVDADPDQLHRILVNLFRNARQAVEATERTTGEVTVTAAAAPGDAVRAEIADDGPGLPARARDHLFQPFAGSGRPGGAGLGLAIARELARAHGGDLVLVRSGPEGAAFSLTLPPPPR